MKSKTDEMEKVYDFDLMLNGGHIKGWLIPKHLQDEIDAALDDRNVERFASYLHNLSKKTQFIVITHRRGTMEASDVLYGVTMQEQGISKLLRLDLNQMETYLGLMV